MKLSLLSGPAWAVSASLLILAVLLLRALLGRRLSAGVQYALWGIVLVRLLLPFQWFPLPIPAGMSHWFAAQTVDIAENMQIDGPWQNDLPAGAQGGVIQPEAQTRPVSPENPADPAADNNSQTTFPAPARQIPWGTLLLWVWRVGTILGAAWLAGVHICFSRRLRRHRKALDCPGCSLPVYVAEGIPSPCLYGFLRPAVYLTPAVAKDPVSMRHVLAHETAHARHRDHIWNLLRCTALVLHWWNPLVWLAVSCSRMDGELACDAAALRLLGDQDRTAYGRTVLQVAAAPQPVLQIVSTMGGGKRELKERLIRIANPPEKAMALSLAAVILAVTLAACSFANPSTPTEEPTQAPFPAIQTLSEGALGIAEPVSADLNHNGVSETIQVLFLENQNTWAISVSEEDSPLVYSESATLSSWDQKSLFLCKVDGEDYLLRYAAYTRASGTYWDYAIFSVEGDGEKTLDAITLRFDETLPPDSHIPFRPVSAAVFLQNLQGYLDGAHLLVSTCAEVNQAYEDTGDWVVYPWEEDIPGFTYREDLTAEENLKALAAAESEAEPPSAALAEYYEVLTQDAIYRPCPFTHVHTLEDVGESLTPSDFALQDLNADGIPELLLSFQDSADKPAAQLLLSWQIAAVVGVELPAGAISDLQTDGSFTFRDGSGEPVAAWRILLNEKRFAVLTAPAPVDLTVLGEGEPVPFYPLSQAAEVLLKQ